MLRITNAIYLTLNLDDDYDIVHTHDCITVLDHITSDCGRQRPVGKLTPEAVRRRHFLLLECNRIFSCELSK
jgi:hypothetical protein